MTEGSGGESRGGSIPPRSTSSAKDVRLHPISAADAKRIVRQIHYSGKVVPNSQIHLGAFLNGRCGGAMQFGPPMRKEFVHPLVEGTGWNDMLELNRMAFADWLPRNSESRCLGFSMRWLRKTYPHLKWILTFADGTQCGDGAIYRAAGFILTGIKKNDGIRINPRTGEYVHTVSAFHQFCSKEHRSWKAVPGFQLRYIFFLESSWRARLTVPELPYSEIERHGARMYKGTKVDAPEV